LPNVFAAVLVVDGEIDTVQVFTTKDKANDFLFETMEGNEHGLFFNDCLEYEPDPCEMVHSPYSGTRIFDCDLNLED